MRFFERLTGPRVLLVGLLLAIGLLRCTWEEPTLFGFAVLYFGGASAVLAVLALVRAGIGGPARGTTILLAILLLIVVAIAFVSVRRIAW